MPLTDTAARNAKPESKPRKLSDEKGLFLLVSPNGGKWWRLKYRIGGKEKLLSLGTYPDVSLKAARDARDLARKDIAAGIDPSEKRKAAKAALTTIDSNSFEAVAREWLNKYRASWTPEHAERIERRFERDVFPWVGKRPIADITAPELLAALRRIESRGALDTAHRALQNCGQVFRYAVATGRAQADPTPSLRGALAPSKETHHAAVTEPKAMGELLRVLHSYKGSFVTLCALKLAPLVFVRPGELRRAEWSEIDFDASEWRIPAGKMKSRAVHIVPLAVQAVAILKELQPLTGSGQYVFPSVRTRTRPMSENTVLGALRRLGYTTGQMTGHGFRSMASTQLNEMGWPPDVIERQLAHAERNKVKAAYNRAEHLAARRQMMQAWADYLDHLTRGDSKVVTLRKMAS
tara:strand:+ start:4128 stop:5348 length:1221 start_codon:yes stop_codon:yes gene_type:complete